jgi:hypothetical protein
MRMVIWRVYFQIKNYTFVNGQLVYNAFKVKNIRPGKDSCLIVNRQNRWKNTITFAVLFGLLAANDAVDKPSKLIAEDKMIDVMYDLSILDAIKYQNPHH